MFAGERETRLEAILTDTTTLCGQIEANAEELKVLLESGDEDRDGDVNKRVFVLEQVLNVCVHACTSCGGGGCFCLLPARRVGTSVAAR